MGGTAAQGGPELTVTVVVDNYNYAQYLPAALDSALAQDHPDVEVVVVDDGSTDASLDVLRGYEDRVRVIAKDNGGQGSAFNAGVRASTGDIVCLLDADDTWLPTKVSRLVAVARQHPRAVMVQHRLQPFGTTVGACRPVPFRLVSGRVDRLVVRSGGWWPFAPASGLAFRRSYLDQVLPVPEEEFRICADAYLADVAPFFGEVVSVPDVLGGYRVHGVNGWAGLAATRESAATMRAYNERWERRVRSLNDVLARSGRRDRVHLRKNFYYQRHLLRLGERGSRVELSRLALIWPAERSPVRRARNALDVLLSGPQVA